MNSIAAYYVLLVSDRAPVAGRPSASIDRPSLIQRVRALIAGSRPASTAAQPA
jgi:hypothetical protein